MDGVRHGIQFVPFNNQIEDTQHANTRDLSRKNDNVTRHDNCEYNIFLGNANGKGHERRIQYKIFVTLSPTELAQKHMRFRNDTTVWVTLEQKNLTDCRNRRFAQWKHKQVIWKIACLLRSFLYYMPYRKKMRGERVEANRNFTMRLNSRKCCMKISKPRNMRFSHDLNRK